MDRSQPTSPERAQSLARSERRKKKKKCQCSKLKFNLSDLICKINTAERSKPVSRAPADGDLRAFSRP